MTVEAANTWLPREGNPGEADCRMHPEGGLRTRRVGETPGKMAKQDRNQEVSYVCEEATRETPQPDLRVDVMCIAHNQTCAQRHNLGGPFSEENAQIRRQIPATELLKE